MLIRTVNFTAGVVRSPESVYISNHVIEATTAKLPIEPAVFVTDALWMMPDVMRLVSQMNTSEMATWNNLTSYTEKLIRYSYIASWDSLNSFYGEETPDLAARKAASMLQASVSKLRVWLWVLGHLLVTVTAIMSLVAHSMYDLTYVVDYAAAAMVAKTQVKMEKAPNLKKLGQMTHITEEYEKMKIKALKNDKEEDQEHVRRPLFKREEESRS